MNDFLSHEQLYNYAGDSITVLRKSNLCPFCSRQAKRTRLRRPLVSILPIRSICKAPCILGLKKLPVVPVTYREKIRVDRSEKLFLKQFLMLLADLGVHVDHIELTYQYVINSYIYKIRCISTINSVFKFKLFVLVLWPSGQGHGFHAIAWGSIPTYTLYFLNQSFFSKFFLYS